MRRTGTLIVGGGQAGLALSRHLVEAGQDHVVLERGRVGERWRTRWDSLRLLSPNWLNLLPYSPEHEDPDGFLAREEFVEYLEDYARSFAAPIEEGVSVLSARPVLGGFEVATSEGSWHARQVVIATGDADQPMIPRMAHDAPEGTLQLHASEYRRPSQLPPGDVVVVGAGASGQQIAAELHASGRDVVLAVGRHSRMVRTYRGRDILAWLSATGALERRLDDIRDKAKALNEANLALSSKPIDLETLHRRGIVVAGRLRGFSGTRALFAGDLHATVASSDAHMAWALERIDAFIEREGVDAGPPEHVAPISLPEGPRAVDLVAGRVAAIVWATGYVRRYPWLEAPEALRPDGELIHHNGITPVPGLSVLGLRFQRRRASHFIGGVGPDAAFIARRICAAEQPRRRRVRPLIVRTAA